MGWDYWVYYEQPPEFISEIMEHMKIESEVTKGKSKAPEIDDPNPDSIFNYKEKED